MKRHRMFQSKAEIRGLSREQVSDLGRPNHPQVQIPVRLLPPLALALVLALNWVKAGARAKARARSGFGPALVSREKTADLVAASFGSAAFAERRKAFRELRAARWELFEQTDFGRGLSRGRPRELCRHSRRETSDHPGRAGCNAFFPNR